jgi:hypothetical protein
MNWDKVARAASAGLNKAAGRSPSEDENPYFVAYTKMKPSDFVPLVQKFGDQKVISYIKEMEALRIKDGNS